MPNDVKAMEMKACPWCGEADNLRVVAGCHVRCSTCCADGPVSDRGDDLDAVEAVRLWNTRPAMEGAWEGIESAPHAMTVMAARFDPSFGEWIYAVVLSPPSKPFTHWRPLPAPPSTIEGGKG